MSERIIGRDEELALLAEFLDGVPAGPVAFLVEGEAGIGKTTIWREAVSAARRRSYHVLACRPLESETQLSFAAFADLLGEVADDTLPTLPKPQRRAIEVALLRAEPEGRPPPQLAVSLAALAALRLLAESAPLVLAVDDAQWLDRSSAAVLQFVAHRLEREPVGMLTVLRIEPPAEDLLDLERAFDRDNLRRLRLGPLAVDALDRLLRSRLQARFLRPTLLELHRVSGGNPFFALEIGRSLLQRGLPLPPEEPLPVPENMRELVRDRLARLPARVRECLLAVAAFSQPTSELVEAALGSRAAGDLAKAVEGGVIAFERERIRFAHPLLGSALYADAAPARRRRLHGRLAEVVADPEERARHLGLACDGPDPDVAAALDEAARRAYSRGAPEAAAELSEQARRLTPPDRSEDVRRRSVEAARYHYEAGDTARARSLLEEAAAASPPGPARADVLRRLGNVRQESESVQVGVELYRQALGEADEHPYLQAAIHQKLAWALSMTGDSEGAARHARLAAELAERMADERLLAFALAALGCFEFLLGRGIDVGMMNRALTLEQSADRLDAEEWYIDECPSMVVGLQLMWSDDLDGARARFEALYGRALERGDELSVSVPLFYLGWLECRAGNWERAARYADEGYQSVLQIGRESGRTALLYPKALVEAHRGRVDEARAAAEEGLAMAERTGHAKFVIRHLSVLGFLELSLGNAAEANRYLGRAAELWASSGIAEPGLFPLLPDAIEALIILGELERAKLLLERLEEQGRTLNRPWALATATRCRGLLAAASRDWERAIRVLEQAVNEHERLPEPFELSRTLLALGTVQRRARQKRAARELLERSLEIFDRLGAPLWAEKARDELARIGGRPARAGRLTPTEERVAELVAAGRTNQEVAQALFVSAKTVEWNLSKVYRKLGVRSRTELAAKIATVSRADRRS